MICIKYFLICIIRSSQHDSIKVYSDEFLYQMRHSVVEKLNLHEKVTNELMRFS